jgi:unsaturated rhamnogalacturonyl hydrolase
MSDSVIQRQPILGEKWAYEWGVILKGIQSVWENTKDPRYFAYIQYCINQYVEPDGNIRTYNVEAYNIDNINTGKLLFFLYSHTHDTRYKEAILCLRAQLADHPRTNSGGFWHKLIYPHQMWLDGIYMGAPFYAEFAQKFDVPTIFDDIAYQVKLITKHTLDEKTGLLYHAWDESHQQAWANPITGQSPHFWARAMGWFVMALVDLFDYFPADHPETPALRKIFTNSIEALAKVQHNGLWYQILDMPERAGNYPEASASCMIVYAMAKGARCGYLSPSYSDMAQKAYGRIIEEFVTVDSADGGVNLNGICGVAGLGGTPYRDGSYAYYLSEPIVTNDDKGVGAFILASAEMEFYPHDS